MAGRFWCDNADVDHLIKEVGPLAFGLLAYFRRHVHGNVIPPEACKHSAIRKTLGYCDETIVDSVLRLEQRNRIRVTRRPGRPNVYEITNDPPDQSGRYPPDESGGSSQNPPDESGGSASTPPMKADTPPRSKRRVPPDESGGSLHIRESIGIREGIEESASGGNPPAPLLGPRPSDDQIRRWFTDLGRPEQADPFLDAMKERGWVTFGSSPVPIVGMDATMAAVRKWIRKADQFAMDRMTSNGNGSRHTARATKPWTPNLVTDADVAMTKAGKSKTET